MQKLLRVLVVGCGSIGQRHIKNLIALKVGEIFSFDVLEDRRRAVRVELGVETTDGLQEAWNRKPDVVLITAPTDVHVALALEAAQHSCHFFIEKPLSHTEEGLNALIGLVERHNLVTMVGCNMRFHPGPIQVKRLIDEGAIGRVIAARIQTGSYLPDWRPHEDYRQSYSSSGLQGGGAVLDCIHEIDLALWYFGSGEVVGAAMLPAENIGLKVEGLAEILIRHQSGVLSSVHLNFVQRDYHRSCQVIGTEGSLYWDFQDTRVRCYKAGGEWQVFEQPPGWTANQMFMDEACYFVDCVRKRAATFNDVERASAVMRVALSAKEHHPVRR